jgi:hypothetical protein
MLAGTAGPISDLEEYSQRKKLSHLVKDRSDVQLYEDGAI